MSRMISVWMVMATALLATACTNPETPAGYEGYVYERPRVRGKGGFRGIVTGPGNAFQFHAIIGVSASQVEDVVVKYGGEKWYERFVREPFRTFVRNAVQQYDSREVKASRAVVAGQVETELQQHLEGSPFMLVSLVVGNIDYPESVAKAVEAKLAAQQLLEEKETQKQIAQRDAEIRVEEAKGIAEAQKIINATLTANYLQHEAIQAQEHMANSPNHTTVYIPVGNNGLPLVHMPKN